MYKIVDERLGLVWRPRRELAAKLLTLGIASVVGFTSVIVNRITAIDRVYICFVICILAGCIFARIFTQPTITTYAAIFNFILIVCSSTSCMMIVLLTVLFIPIRSISAVASIVLRSTCIIDFVHILAFVTNVIRILADCTSVSFIVHIFTRSTITIHAVSFNFIVIVYAS